MRAPRLCEQGRESRFSRALQFSLSSQNTHHRLVSQQRTIVPRHCPSVSSLRGSSTAKAVLFHLAEQMQSHLPDSQEAQSEYGLLIAGLAILAESLLPRALVDGALRELPVVL